jgi:hypothetical protein
VSSVLRRSALLVGAMCASVVATFVATPIAQAADPITTQGSPTLTAPNDDPGSVTPLKNVVLQWSAVQYAASYEVQISPNGDWTNNTVTLPNGGVTSNNLYEVPLSLPHASYFWRVRGLGSSGGHTAFSSSRQFLREWVAPITTLVTPGDIAAGDPTLAWKPVADASIYRVRFSTADDFPADKTLSCWTASTSFTPYGTQMASTEKINEPCFDETALTTGKDYFWDLRAFDDSTAPQLVADTAPDGQWDCAQAQPECDASRVSGSFTFSAPAAGAPAAGGTVTGLKTTWHTTALPGTDCSGTVATCPVTPTFSWTAYPGANFYRVHVYRDPQLTNTYRVYTTARTSFTPREAFFDAQAGTPYYWTVSAGTCKNSASDLQCSQAPAGSQPTSPSCAKSSNATPAPSIDSTGLSPTSMAAATQTTVTLTGSNFAANACVQSTGNAGLISNISVNGTGDAITFDYTAPASEQGVTFLVVNPDGGTSNESPTLQITGTSDKIVFFGVGGPAMFQKQSQPVTLSAPLNGSSINSRTVTFQWNSFLSTGGQSAYDVRNYRLQLASDSSFDSVALDTDTIDMTRFTNPTALIPDGHWFWRIQPIDESGNHLTWSGTRSFTKDSAPPVFSFTDSGRVSTTSPLHVKVNDSSLQGTVSSSTLSVAPVVGGGVALAGSWRQTSTTAWTFTPSSVLVPGQSYRLSVIGSALKDAAGNTAVAASRTDRVAGNVDDKNRAWHFSSGWKRISSSSASGGTFVRGGSGATATVKVVGGSVSVYGCKAPRLGKMRVSVDGVVKTTRSLAQSFTSCGVLVWKGSVSNSAVHTVRVSAVRGAVDLDRAVVS